VAGDQRFIMLTTNSNATCGLTADGDAFCWGVIRTTKYGPVIADAPTAMGWPPLAALRLGPWLAPCGLRVDGTAYCDVPAGHEDVRFRDIVHDSHGCGIRDDGTVLCWGRRDRGQLGDGIDGWVAEPQRVIGFSRGG
jgi:alpha-tubulin suppressor-like RCC1 family protein